MTQPTRKTTSSKPKSSTADAQSSHKKLNPRESSTPDVITDSIRAFMQEAGRYEVLPYEEVIGLTRQIQAGQALIEAKEKQQKQTSKPLSEVEWATLVEMDINQLRRTLAMAKRAKDKMVQHNLKLVISIAKRYVTPKHPLQDLIQEGSIGLIRGTEKFDPEKGYQFSTYAYWWIRQAITRYKHQDRTIRIPIHQQEEIARMRKAYRQIGKPNPSREEVATAMEITVDELEELLLLSRGTQSLNIKVGDNDDELGDFIGDQVSSSQHHLTETQITVEQLMAKAGLSDQERCILHERYIEGRSLDDVGKDYNLSRERIRQIQRKALGKVQRVARMQ